MKKIMMMALAVAILSVSYSCKKGVEGSDAEKLDDRATLERLFQSLNGANWDEDDKANWCTDAPLSEWDGVKTNAEGRVTELRLVSSAVKGQLPAEIINLSELEVLDLSLSNRDSVVKNPVPAELFRLPKLKNLAVRVFVKNDAAADQYGTLPETINLPALEHLTTNRIIGNYSQLAQMKNLKSITIKYSCADIPDEIGQLSNLEDIFWENAEEQLNTRPLTQEIGKLSKLRFFRYYPEGSKDEAVPEVLKNLKALENIQTKKLCSKDAELPSWLFELPELAYVSIEESNLSGDLPATIGSNGKLRSLDLSNNPKLTGTIPASIANCDKFYSLELDKTGVSQTLPASLKGLKEFSKFGDKIFK